MRISDWSSDVCSSDLRIACPRIESRTGSRPRSVQRMCWVSVTAWARRVRIKGFSPKRHAFIRSRDDKTKGRGMATDLDRRMAAGIAQLTSAEGTLPLTDIALDGRRLPMYASAPPALPPSFAQYFREHAIPTFLVAV